MARRQQDPLFGPQGYYLARRPPAEAPARFRTRSFRFWSQVGRAAIWSPIWMIPVCLVLGFAFSWWIWLSLLGAVILMFTVGINTANHFKSLPLEQKRFLPSWIKSNLEVPQGTDLSRPLPPQQALERYEPREQRLLAALWQLDEGIGKLNAAAAQLSSQLKDDRVDAVKKLETEARAAIADGNQELAASLVESALAHEKHQAWLEEQHERVSVQVRFLEAKQSNIKARLSLIHTQRESLKAQRAAAEARAAVGEMMAGFEDVDLDLEGGLALERLKDEAVEAEARALAMEELAERALEESAADPGRQLEALVLRPEVEARLKELMPQQGQPHA